MKKLLYIFLGLILIIACSPDETPCDTTPSFSNISVSQVSYTSFNISGTISPSDCDSNVISQGIVYSTNELPTQSNNSIVFSNGSYSESITGLSLSTTYYLRPFFFNQEDVFYGNQVSATTLSSLISFSNIEHSPSITSVSIAADYSFEEGQGVSASSKGVILNGVQYEDSESTDESISVNIEGLESDTNYSYSMFVVNEFGTTQSSSTSFQTDNSSSVVSSLTVSDVDFTSVSLAATYENLYSGEDITTDKGIIVSLNENFENQTEYSSSSDANIIEVSLTALETNTVYYVKGYVENEYGINYGEETSFETNDAGYNFNSINITGIDFETADSSVTFSQVEGVFTPPTSKGFRVSQNENFSGYTDYNDNNNIENGTSIALSFESLTVNTMYYVKAFVTNEYGTFFSDEAALFQTLSIDYVSSYVVNAVGYDYAQIDVEYNQSSGSMVEVLEKGIEIYQTPSYNVVDTNSPDGNMSLTMSNLVHNSNYTFVGYITTQYGKYYLEDTVEVNTLDATPSFSSSTSDIDFDSVNILTTFSFAAETTNSVVRIVLSNSESQQYIDLDNNTTSQESTVDNLITNTNYSYYIEVLNQYGTFSSSTYQFATFNDEPNIDFSYELTGENQITLTGSITPANGDESINSIYIQYKHHEENNYNTINLSSSNYSISEVLNDLAQGPNYNFKLVVINDYNTFEENLYYNLPVTYEVGDYLFGGIIAYIDSSGYHGYIMSEMQYAVNGLQWSTDDTSSDDLSYLTGYGVAATTHPDGEENTQIIVDFHSGISASAPAAEYCANLNVNGYDDWFLGSMNDYDLTLANTLPSLWPASAVHNLVWTSNTYWWSGTPDEHRFAMYNYYNGQHGSTANKEADWYSVWPMRKF
jgi:hypothetical protein